MALTLDRYARVDVTQIADVLYCANGTDNCFITDALESGRFEGTVSTTAPDDTSMTVTENAGAGSALPSGAVYTYYIAYVRDAGTTYPQMISGASGGISETLTADRDQIDLASIPVSSDDQVTDRWVYRSGNTITVPRFVAAIGDNTTTTFTDTMSDAAKPKGLGPWPSQSCSGAWMPSLDSGGFATRVPTRCSSTTS